MRRLPGLILAVLGFLAVTGAAGDRGTGAADPGLVQAIARGAWTTYRSAAGGGWEADVVRTPRTVSVLLEGDPSPGDLRSLGAVTGCRAGAVWSVRVPGNRLAALASLGGVTRVQLARPVDMRLDVSIPDVRAAGLRMRLGAEWSGLTGAGVVVGIVDSGLDVTHEDFRRSDGSTRVLAYWDQSDASGGPPAGFGYGSEWSSSEIDAGMFGPGDRVGHGTHVTGIAAGNGRGSDVDSLRYRYAGVAPNADLVIVSADVLLETGVLDGVSYIFETAAAAGKPAVVNLSLGSQFGPHDGTALLDVGIDALLGPGRLAVAAAGNEGDDRVHAELHVPGGGADSTSLYVPDYVPGPALDFLVVDAFYRSPDSLAVTLVSPSGKRFGPHGLETTVSDFLTGEGTLFLTHTDPDPASTNLQVQFDLSDFDPDSSSGGGVPGPAPGTWRVVFEDLGGEGGEVDLWVALANIRDFAGVPPLWVGDRYDPAEEVSSPGTASRVVAVGSYNTRNCWPVSGDSTRCSSAPGNLGEPGRITFFSSRGPTRDDRNKPEVVAPGFVVVSALSSQMSPEHRTMYGVDRNLDPDAQHLVFAGTSMAAPHVSGALALLLEIDPALTPEAAQSRVAAGAREDEYTGEGWTPQAGFGKLDVAALVDTAVAVVGHEIRIETLGGRPRLIWEADAWGPVSGFRLASRLRDGAWRDRGTFGGPGPHVWIDEEAAPGARYRLEAFLRNGELRFWAEATWEAAEAPLVGPANPNPFSGRTAIPVRVPAGSRTRVTGEVFDVRGRRIRDLAGFVDASSGTGRLVWDGTDDHGVPVEAGIFWVRVRSGGGSRSIKLVRLRDGR